MDSLQKDGDCIISGGTIYTMEPEKPYAEAMVIKEGRIVYIGDIDGARHLRRSSTTTIDLHGKIALPGFIESHCHLYHVGMWAGKNWINCDNLHSIDEIISALQAKAKDISQGVPLLAYRYDDVKLKEKRHPIRLDFDPFFPETPIFMYHFGQHIMTVNSAGLRLAGITGSTKEPEGGIIDRDERGEPTGILRESALNLIRTCLPTYTEDEIINCLKDASHMYLAAGITSVFEGYLGKMGGIKEVYALARIAKDGGLPVRYETAIPYLLWKELQGGAGPGLVWGGDPVWIRPVSMKLFQDGSLFNQAALSTPSRGQRKSADQYLFYPQAELERMILDAHTSGWPVLVHANGDVAIQTVLDAYERALEVKSGMNLRHRIDHCQFVTDEQLDRIAHLGIAVTFLAIHLWHWGDRHIVNFGAQRAARLSPMASALKRGIRFGMHNDGPFTPIDALASIGVAVNRRSITGDELGPEEAISVDDALRAFTLGNAYASSDENIKGSLKEGKLGDVVVLEADPYRVNPEEIKDIPVSMTILAGKIAYQKQ